MKHSESLGQLTAALAKAQGAFTAVKRSGKDKHKDRTYSTLDDVIAAIRGPLSANGLSVTQPLSSGVDGSFVLETVLLHESGEWLSCAAILPTLAGNKSMNELQTFGAALTYMRRYQLTALLGVNAEEDTDGRKQEQPQRQPQRQQRGNGGQRKPSRPYTPEMLKKGITKRIEDDNGELASVNQRGLMVSKLEECFAGAEDAEARRKSVQRFLVGKDSSKLVTKREASAMLKWLVPDGKDDDTGDYPLCQHAPAEAAAIVRVAMVEAGQDELFEM